MNFKPPGPPKPPTQPDAPGQPPQPAAPGQPGQQQPAGTLGQPPQPAAPRQPGQQQPAGTLGQPALERRRVAGTRAATTWTAAAGWYAGTTTATRCAATTWTAAAGWYAGTTTATRCAATTWTAAAGWYAGTVIRTVARSEVRPSHRDEVGTATATRCAGTTWTAAATRCAATTSSGKRSLCSLGTLAESRRVQCPREIIPKTTARGSPPAQPKNVPQYSKTRIPGHCSGAERRFGRDHSDAHKYLMPGTNSLPRRKGSRTRASGSPRLRMNRCAIRATVAVTRYNKESNLLERATYKFEAVAKIGNEYQIKPLGEISIPKLERRPAESARQWYTDIVPQGQGAGV